MERDKEFRKRNWMRKVIYFLLSGMVYGTCYMGLVLVLMAVNQLIVISPYIRIVLYILFFILARFLTIRIMNLKWISSFILQL